MTKFIAVLSLFVLSFFPVQGQCNLNTSICQQGALAGPFTFIPASNNPSTCLDFVNGQNTNNYAYIVLYITQGGLLNLLIEGNNTGPDLGCLDVAIFNITNLSNPCAQLSPLNEIGCNYVVPCDGCAEFGFAIGGCPAQIPAPLVQTGDVIMILVEDWSNTQTSFSLSLGNTANSAQTGPPDATILSSGQICSDDPPVQLNAVNMGGTWSGPGVSASGVFNPAMAGLGTHTINYSIGNAPCNDSDQTTITVVDCSSCAFTFIQTNATPCNGLNNTFNINGFVEFSTPPTTGTLTISDCNGNSQTFTPPFVSPLNYSFNNIQAGGTTNCTVTATFSADPTCTITGLPFDYPASCACAAHVGTFTNTLTGSSNLLTPYNLCFGDELNIVGNGDFIPAAQSTNNIVYDPGIWLLVYECPPTIFPQGEINDDPCLLGVASDSNAAWTIINDIGDGETFYFVPVTMYSMVEDFYTSTNSLENCYDLGPIYPVTYLPEVVATQTSNCANGSVTATVSGGSAEIYGSAFTAQNLQPASASFVNTTANNNGTITINGLATGQSYSFDILDVNGCFVTVSGVFQGAPMVGIQYPQTSYCVGQTNPTPTISGQNGGTFTANNAGLVINATTGQINLTTSTPGTYTVTYQVGDPACPSIGTTTVTITSPVTPIFAPVGPFCQGATIPALPTTSQNNITGTWSPAINNNATTTYTFTPAANQCTSTQTLTIEITPQIQPTFVQVGPFCQGAAIAPLPTTSQNNVTGTWSPAINNQQTTTYTFTPSANQCAATASMTILISTEILPTFAQAGPFCIGSAIPALPTISQNNVTGTWSPAINNQQTTTYTFTPNPNQCAVPTTMTVVITNEITPTFAPVGAFCQGSTIPALPTTSQNNITGTWSPAINNQTTSTYTFTPNPNQCAVSASMTVVVNAPVTPTFAPVGPFCQGATIPALPTTSQNNIIGTWSPAINNNATTTYTFTPAANQCASTQTLTIEITPQIQPTFAQVGPFCQGAAIAPLPTTSQNNVSGTWSPAINNQQTTTYTFTPSANQCAATASMTIVISTEILPTFAQAGPFCIGSVIPALPTTSQNNITGTWSPAINNQQTTTYTFTPNPNQCAVPTTMTVVITNEITPTFAPVGPFCQGATIPALPTTSQNNITGTWSPAINNQTTSTYTFTPNPNQCAVSASMTVVVNAPVTPTFAPVGPFCQGATIPALPTTSQNNITGTWSPAINNNATTTYTFTPAANQCASTQILTIEITPQIQPTFAQVGPFCQGAAIAPLPTTSQNNVSGTWSPAINNQQTTTYTFTPSANQCAATASMTIVISTSIIPLFDPVGPFCAGDVIPALPTTSQNNANGSWSPAINNQQTTTHTFTPAAGQAGCFTTTSTTIQIDQPNTLNIIGEDCVLGDFNWVTWNSIAANMANGTVGSNAISVTFTTGGMFQTASVFSGNTFPAQYNIPINSPALAGQNTGSMTFCFDQPMTNPQVAFSSLGNNSASVQINTSVPYNTVWVGQGMNYLNNQSIIGTEGFNIIEFPGVHTCITIDFLAPEFYWNIVFGGQTLTCPIDPICEGESLTLIAQGSNNVIWSPLTDLIPVSNTEVLVSPNATTTYTITDNNACQSQASIIVEVVPNEQPLFETFDVYCSGAAIPALPTTSLNNITGTWSPAINNLQTTTYTFTPDTTFCAWPASTIIEISFPTTSTTEASLCADALPFFWNGQSINATGFYESNLISQNGCDSLAILEFTVLDLQTSTSNAVICESELPYFWNGQTYNASGNYSITLLGSNGCDSIATLILTVAPIPNPNFNAFNAVGCSPLTVSFQNNTFGESVSCLWNFGNGQTGFGCNAVTHTFELEGCYDVSLTVTSSAGCVGTTTFEDLVCVTATPSASFIPNPTTATTTNPLINFINTSSNATNYSWDFGDDSGNSNQESPSHIYPEEQGEYVVTLIAYNGTCTDTAFQLISIQSEPIFYVPNTFTPDGDLFNQTFLPIFTAGFDPYGYNLLIFNRWGEVLFESNNADIGWDGTYGGKVCQDGTYIWQITFKELGRDKRQIIRGHVNLLR